MWHRSKSANNESNSLGKDEIRAIRYQHSTLTARAIVGVKFAARSGCWSPLHQPVGRFSTTTQLRRATEWHRNFSFPPSPAPRPLLAPFLHRYRYDGRRATSRGGFGSSERQRRAVRVPLFLFGSLLALAPLEPGGEAPSSSSSSSHPSRPSRQAQVPWKMSAIVSV